MRTVQHKTIGYRRYFESVQDLPLDQWIYLGFRYDISTGFYFSPLQLRIIHITEQFFQYSRWRHLKLSWAPSLPEAIAVIVFFIFQAPHYCFIFSNAECPVIVSLCNCRRYSFILSITVVIVSFIKRVLFLFSIAISTGLFSKQSSKLPGISLGWHRCKDSQIFSLSICSWSLCVFIK